MFGQLLRKIREFFNNPHGKGKESFKISFFKGAGETPLAEIDFDVMDVFEMDAKLFQSLEKATHLYDELSKIPQHFELYTMPYTLNFARELREINEEYREMISNLKEQLPEEEYRHIRIFLITKKEESGKVIENFRKLSFNVLGMISEEEAKEIMVS